MAESIPSGVGGGTSNGTEPRRRGVGSPPSSWAGVCLRGALFVRSLVSLGLLLNAALSADRRAPPPSLSSGLSLSPQCHVTADTSKTMTTFCPDYDEDK